jgi:hypothetical protein
MIIFDNPGTVPAPAGLYSHVVRVELGGKTILQLSGQVAKVSRLWVPGALLEVEVLAIT